MASTTLELVPFLVPTNATIVADVAPKAEGYNEAVPVIAISSLDAATRQTLIDEFAASVLAL